MRLAAFAFLLVACGSKPRIVEPPNEDASVENAERVLAECTNDGGPEIDTKLDLGPVCDPCPQTQPSPNETCDQPGLACEYGDSFWGSCNTILQCSAPNGPIGSAWRLVHAPDKNCPRSATTTGGPCPSAAPLDQSCCTAPDDVVCVYSNHVNAICTGKQWQVFQLACPKRARLGCSCTMEMSCHGPCSIGPSCHDGKWMLSEIPCPP